MTLALLTKENFFKAFKNQSYVDKLKEIPQTFKVEHDEENKVTTIAIYGIIGDSWFSESFSANDIDRALNEAGDNDVVINLNSPGGDAFDGISIYNRLKRHPGKVTIFVDGWACSAASIIAMAGDEVVMGTGSMLMIHEAWSVVIGSKTDLRKEASVLEELEEGMIDIYMTKANVDREELREKVDAETWFSAKSAVEIGFADKVEGSEDEGDGKEGNTNNSTIKMKSNEDKKAILNELKTVLGKDTFEQEPKKPAAKRRVLF